MTKISTQKERILQFIDYKGFSKNKFYTETGVSNGVLDKKSGLSMDTIEKIYSKYPEINPEWLLTGKGKMLKNVSSQTIAQEALPMVDSRIEVLLKEKIALLEENKVLLQEKIAKLEADIQALKSI